MNRRTLLLLSLVALLLLVTTWLSQKERGPKPVTEAEGPVTNYFIRGLDGTIMGADGRPSHHLQSETLLHYADSQHVKLEQPLLTVFLPEGEQWQIEAQQGLLDDENNQISLEGSVVLTQRSGKQPLTVETDRLQLYPENRYGESDARVTISAPSGRISGVGMQLYGEERRLLLLSKVEGHYDSTMR